MNLKLSTWSYQLGVINLVVFRNYNLELLFMMSLDEQSEILSIREIIESVQLGDSTNPYITNGDKYWVKNGELHRVDGPAMEYVDGTREWYQHGLLHRDNGPAMEYPDGSKYWYLYGEEHRNPDDGPAEDINVEKFFSSYGITVIEAVMKIHKEREEQSYYLHGWNLIRMDSHRIYNLETKDH